MLKIELKVELAHRSLTIGNLHSSSNSKDEPGGLRKIFGVSLDYNNDSH